jgi:hypothetical protein
MVFYPLCWGSGGILMGINSVTCQLINWDVDIFSLTAHLQNKKDNIVWLCTTVYGHTDPHLKYVFLAELLSIGSNWAGPWIVGGDFNSIRSHTEKKGVCFDLSNMDAFNNRVNDSVLIDLKCTDRQFTWARRGKSSQMACLDRIFVNQVWPIVFPNTRTYSFDRTMSDHSPICLDNGISQLIPPSMFKFEAFWLNQEGFSELMAKWWSSFPPGPLIAQIWKLKLDQLRIKLKGWNANINRTLKDKKKTFIFVYSSF